MITNPSTSTFETLEEYAERTHSLLAEEGLGEWLLANLTPSSRVSRMGTC